MFSWLFALYVYVFFSFRIQRVSVVIMHFIFNLIIQVVLHVPMFMRTRDVMYAYNDEHYR